MHYARRRLMTDRRIQLREVRTDLRRVAYPADDSNMTISRDGKALRSPGTPLTPSAITREPTRQSHW